MSRVYNFSPGPAMLPEAVLSQVRDELLDWHHSGMSAIEIPHRGEAFQAFANEAEADLRQLLAIPDHYSVLFLQGGAQAHFALIPMNILGSYRKAAYLDTGLWSKKSIEAARPYCDVQVVASTESSKYTRIPDSLEWKIPKDAAYLYYVDNETINGVEFFDIPNVDALPLVCDMSSSLLSKPIDVSRFGLIFACAQKNIGPAGLTLVIVRNDLLERGAIAQTPKPFNYALQAQNHSVLNTPPTFAWYVAGLVFKWLRQEGGLSEMAKRNQKKASALYEFIDQSNFYHNHVDPSCRSRMNVVFNLSDEKRNAQFIKQSTEKGLCHLKGHRLVGGMRASLYNAMPKAGVDALIAFMRDFEKQ